MMKGNETRRSTGQGFPEERESIFRSSAMELQNPRVLVFCGLMGALAIVLSVVGTVRIGSYIRIGLSGIPARMVDLLFGPVVGCIFGGVMDILKYLVTPSGAFFPGFTLSAMLTGAIFGVFLYHKKPTLWRILVPEILVRVFVNLLLNTVWLSILYGEGFLALLPGRVVSNLVQIPVETLLIFAVLQATQKTAARFFPLNG